MSVTFITAAKVAPAGLEFTVWVTTSSANISGDTITWGDDTGGVATWTSPTSTTGDIYSYLASGTILVPTSYLVAGAKNVKITADAGAALGSAPLTIKFEDWGATPKLGDVISSDLVMYPKDDPATNGILYEASVTKTNGDVVVGAEVQWFILPKGSVTKLYDASNTKITLARGGQWAPTITNSLGYAQVKVTASSTQAVTMQATSPSSGMFGTTDTAYFIDQDAPNVPQITNQAPWVTGVKDGFLDVSGKQSFVEFLPPIAPKYASSANIAFLYFAGWTSPTTSSADVPWTTGDASTLQSQTNVDDMPVPDIIISTNGEANQTLLFIQNSAGQVYKTGTYAFGGSGTSVNQPDVNIPPSARPFDAPGVNPNPGIGGYITDDTLKHHVPANTYPDGLMLQFGRTLGTTYATGSGKVVFNFYMNGVDKNKQPYNRRWTVDALEALDPATTYYHAVLDYNKATGYYQNQDNKYGLFWAEMAFVPTGQENNRQAWTYSQYNSYILATGV